jgi:iron complex outermembrane receptor protein/outer membrane receptor for ferrienterochelin and colicins
MRFILLFVASLFFISSSAQQQSVIIVRSAASKLPVYAATISINGKAVAITDSLGHAMISLPSGKNFVSISAIGFEIKSDSILFPLAKNYIVELKLFEKTIEEVVVVSTARNGQRIENAPMKVEVLGREELDEENTIKPANIASLLSDVSGVQIQQSSAVNNNSAIRIQGLDSRYTQVLRDGMPLFEGFSGSFGILSVPPIDLKQIELVKGSASTLYGGGAIAGLVNLISRRPTEKKVNTLTLNYSTLKEKTINLFASEKFKKIGYTFFTGYTAQKPTDVNKDGFSDVPQLNNFEFHPRLFWYPSSKSTLIFGVNTQFEHREGGDMQFLNNNNIFPHIFYEQHTSVRNVLELQWEQTFTQDLKLTFKNNFSSFSRLLDETGFSMKALQLNRFSELSLLYHHGKTSLVGGFNALGDNFQKRLANQPVAWGNNSNQTFGLFAQSTTRFNEENVLEAGIREDFHSKYGSFFLPRIAYFHRFSEHWASRAGVGLGYNIPNIFNAYFIDLPLTSLHSLTPDAVAERSVGYNFEFNYKKKWASGNRIFINQAFFLTQVNKPSIPITDWFSGYIFYTNASKPVVSKGADTYVSASIGEYELYLGYTFTIATRNYEIANKTMPLTPKHRAAFTLVREFDNGFRFGLEGSYNGSQQRLDATKTPGYFFMAAMLDKKVGDHLRFVLNCENLLNYKQSKIEPLYYGTIDDPHFKELWAPIDGIVANLSLFVSF